MHKATLVFQLDSKISVHSVLKKSPENSSPGAGKAVLIDSGLPAKRTMRRNRPRCSKSFLAITQKKTTHILPVFGAPQVRREVENLIHPLEVFVSNGLQGHPYRISGKHSPPCLSTVFFCCFFFPSEMLVICIKPTSSL